MTQRLVYIFVGLVLLLTIPTATLAASPNSRENGARNNIKKIEPSMTRATPLPTTKMTSCAARVDSVKTRMAQLLKLVTTMENTFDKIATRVETYYKSKVIPTGKTVSTYDNLVMDISNQKATVGKALTKAQTDIDGFNCISQNPKVLMSEFRQDMQSVKTDLNNYRTAIKDLIAAVRPVSAEMEQKPSENLTPSKYLNY